MKNDNDKWSMTTNGLRVASPHLAQIFYYYQIRMQTGSQDVSFMPLNNTIKRQKQEIQLAQKLFIEREHY